MGGNVKRRHHTVARLILEGFAQRGQVDAWRRDGRRFRTSVQDTTVLGDFYAFNTSDGQKRREVEDWFAEEVEAPVAEVVRRLRCGDQPKVSDGPVLARLVAASLMRTRTTRSLMRQIDEHLGPTLLMARLATENGIDLLDASPEFVERLRAAARQRLAEHPRDPGELARSTLRTMLRKYDEMTQELTPWHWWCEHTSQAAFIIGDAPVVTIDVRQDGGWQGLLPSGSPVYLPLSATSVLVGAATAPLASNLDATPSTVDMVNATLAKSAYDCLYKHPDMTWPANMQLASHHPTLRQPRHTIRRKDDDSPPTFPATFPEPESDSVGRLLELLEATKTIE